MTETNVLKSEITALRERLARLHEAGARITEELELDMVLREVMEAARSLTGASFSGITMLDDEGELLDFITPEFSEQQYQALVEMPAGEQFFRHLHNLAAPLRVDDLPAYVEGLGLGPFPLPLASYCCLPIRHRGRHVGSVHLADKQGESGFTAEDEETLELFAQQAAIAIANARRMHDERRARADLETLVDTSPVGVALFDAPEGRLVLLNREAQRIIDAVREPGQTPEELLNALSYRRGDGREIAAGELPLARVLTTSQTVRAEEIVLIAADGRQASVIVNATPIRSAHGQVESVVVTLQDLAPLEDLVRMRAEFLGMVSHELRAPLSSIMGSVGALIKSGLGLDPAAATQFLRIIEEQAEHMEALITDLLDVARIESGELSVRPEPVGLDALVEAARSAFLTGSVNHELEIELPAELGWVMADPRRIVQVLLNLLRNAARQSPGRGAIRLSAQQRDAQIQVTIADDGIGIPPERLEQLFRVISRRETAEREPSHSASESGLGLAICQGIVEAHGGRIWAESEGTDEGAQFHFTLPAVEAAELPPEPGSSEPLRGRFRILVVDDDPQTLRYVRDTLEEAGFDPILTGDPEAVRRLIAERRPHLVLLDLMLPEVDGMELMEQIPALRDLPVIFLSAYGGDARVAKALELGADDYIAKPFSPTELVARIKTVLRRVSAAHELQPEPTGPLSWGELRLDFSDRQATLSGSPLELTNLEYRLLAELARHAPELRTNAELLPRVWGPAHSGRPGAVRTLVKQLRRKLGDEAETPRYIINEPRAGYRMPRPD
jgi:PAS domain S-box-containing protein